MEKRFKKTFIVTVLKGVLISMKGCALIPDSKWGPDEKKIIDTTNYMTSRGFHSITSDTLYRVATGLGYRSKNLQGLSDWIESLPDDPAKNVANDNTFGVILPELMDGMIVGTDSFGVDECDEETSIAQEEDGNMADLEERTVTSARDGDGGMIDPYSEGRELRRALANTGRL